MRRRSLIKPVRMALLLRQSIHNATVDLAVAQVERYNFTTSIGIEPSAAEDWELRVFCFVLLDSRGGR